MSTFYSNEEQNRIWPQLISFKSKIDCDLMYRSLQNLLCSQKVPFHPGLQPDSQTPFNASQLIQLDPHISLQFLPNDLFTHPKKIRQRDAKTTERVY